MKTSWWTESILEKGLRASLQETESVISMRPSSQQEQLHPSLPPTLFDAIRGPNHQPALTLYAFFYRLDPGVFGVPKNLTWFPILGTRSGVTVAIVEDLCMPSAGTLASAVHLHHLLLSDSPGLSHSA